MKKRPAVKGGPMWDAQVISLNHRIFYIHDVHRLLTNDDSSLHTPERRFRCNI